VSEQVDEGYLSEPRSIEFKTEGGLTAFMNFYEPRNRDFQLPAGAKPALLVKIHGGPTAQASPAFSLATQYWTSRGERRSHTHASQDTVYTICREFCGTALVVISMLWGRGVIRQGTASPT
jgi:hypothetical protein